MMLRRPLEITLTALVGMVDDASGAALRQRHFQG
jgi:hypothetical protein